MASPSSCGSERCEIPFGSNRFVEGTYERNNDLCFTDTLIDPGCEMGTCERKRRGLCALAPARHPRVHLPPDNLVMCGPSGPGTDPGWPFPDYWWISTGTPGTTSYQTCPDGFAGQAQWTCSLGGWLGYPDLSKCRKIDTGKAIEALKEENSVPSEVVLSLYQEVNAEDQIGAGDIGSIIGVLDEALKVQNDRIEGQEDKYAYADNYTHISSSLMNDILKRFETWLGIPLPKRRSELTRMQQNIDGVSRSLAKYMVGQTTSRTYSFESLGKYMSPLQAFQSDICLGQIMGSHSSLALEWRNTLMHREHHCQRFISMLLLPL